MLNFMFLIHLNIAPMIFLQGPHCQIYPMMHQIRLGNLFPEELKIKTKTKISQIYRKLDPDKPSYTVTAAGGGGTFMYHWTNRELTNRERARIQTFPDNYEFVGKYSSVRKQIGMAVPCRLAEIVTTAILNSFAGVEYPWIEANLIGGLRDQSVSWIAFLKC